MRKSQSLEARFLRIHQASYEATGGAIGHRLIGVPTLLFTTTGQPPAVGDASGVARVTKSRRDDSIP